MGGVRIRGDVCVGIGDRIEGVRIGGDTCVGMGDRERRKGMGGGEREGIGVISGDEVSGKGGVSIRGGREERFLSGLGEGGSQGSAHNDLCRLVSKLGDE